MSREMLCGFVIGVSVIFLIGAAQVSNRYKNESDVLAEFQNVYLNFQPKQFEVLSSTPVYRDIKEGQFFVVQTGGVQNIFTRIGNVLYRANLTAN